MESDVAKQKIIRCKNCGSKSPDNLIVCATCGADLEPKRFSFFGLGLIIVLVGLLYFGYIKLAPVISLAQQGSRAVATEVISARTRYLYPAWRITPKNLGPAASPTAYMKM